LFILGAKVTIDPIPGRILKIQPDTPFLIGAPHYTFYLSEKIFPPQVIKRGKTAYAVLILMTLNPEVHSTPLLAIVAPNLARLSTSVIIEFN